MRRNTPTLIFASVALALASIGAHAQSQSNGPANNPANNAARNVTMQSGSTALTPQALAGANGPAIKPNPNDLRVRVRNFVEVEPGVFQEVYLVDAATAEAGTVALESGSAESLQIQTVDAQPTLELSNTTTAVVVGADAVAPDSIATPELDKAVARQKARDRKVIAINGQRWNMIVPRTNVDRTHQMPDDPPSPLLGR